MTIIGAYLNEDNHIIMFADMRTVVYGDIIQSEQRKKICKINDWDKEWYLSSCGNADCREEFLDWYASQEKKLPIHKAFSVWYRGAKDHQDWFAFITDKEKVYCVSENIAEIHTLPFCGSEFISWVLIGQKEKLTMNSVYDICKKYYSVCGKNMMFIDVVTWETVEIPEDLKKWEGNALIFLDSIK